MKNKWAIVLGTFAVVVVAAVFVNAQYQKGDIIGIAKLQGQPGTQALLPQDGNCNSAWTPVARGEFSYSGPSEEHDFILTGGSLSNINQAVRKGCDVKLMFHRQGNEAGFRYWGDIFSCSVVTVDSTWLGCSADGKTSAGGLFDAQFYIRTDGGGIGQIHMTAQTTQHETRLLSSMILEDPEPRKISLTIFAKK